MKLKSYLQEYSLTELITKIWFRLLSGMGFRCSETIFFHLESLRLSNKDPRLTPSIKIDILEKSRLKEFNNINIYNFLDVDYILNNPKYKIIIALKGDAIIGFLIIHYSETHTIHKLGKWDLRDNEGWIGSSFVTMDQRGKGVHPALINYSLNYLKGIGVEHIYTCVNSKNIASVKGLRKNNFKIIGRLKFQPFKAPIKEFTRVDFHDKLKL